MEVEPVPKLVRRDGGRVVASGAAPACLDQLRQSPGPRLPAHRHSPSVSQITLISCSIQEYPARRAGHPARRCAATLSATHAQHIDSPCRPLAGIHLVLLT